MTAPLTKPQLKMALGFTRYAKALVVNNGDTLSARAFAESQRWDDTPGTVFALKSAVDAMSSSNSDPIASLRPVAREFLAVVRSQSVLGRLQGLRRVPENVSMLKVSSGPSVHWVGEGKAAPVSAMSMERETLQFSKIIAIVVVTSELMMKTGEIADIALAQELVAAVAAFEDAAFLNPDTAATTDNPASICNGAPSSDSTGSTAAAVRADLKTLIGNFTAGQDVALERAVIVMHPRSALHLSLLEGTAGGQAFPNMGVRGGSIAGIPVLTSGACTLTGSPSETFAALIDPMQVMFAEDGGAEVQVVQHGSVQLSDAPSSTASTQLSLWQSGLRALRVKLPVVWKRTGGVAVLRGINF